MTDEVLEAPFIKLVGTEIRPAANASQRLSMLLWGNSGCGKTALASTAPGKKLWLQFDRNGTSALGKRDDIVVADYSDLPLSKVHDFKEGGIIETSLLSLIKNEKQLEDMQTIVFDSVTQYADMALSYAITSGKANEGKFTATMEKPGWTAYGIRNRYTLSAARMISRVAAMTGKHLIYNCHEGTPDKDKEGNITSITVLLGGDLPELLPSNISEVWFMQDTGHARNVYVRPWMFRKPMRTRMFRTQGADMTFPVRYDMYENKGEGINDWYERWKANGFAPIALPK